MLIVSMTIALLEHRLTWLVYHSTLAGLEVFDSVMVMTLSGYTLNVERWTAEDIASDPRPEVIASVIDRLKRELAKFEQRLALEHSFSLGMAAVYLVHGIRGATYTGRMFEAQLP